MGDNPLKTAEARHDLLIDYWGMGLTPEVTHRYMAKLFRQQAEKKADQGPSKKDKKKKKKGSQDKKDPNTEDSISLGFIDHLFKRFENEGEEGRKFREKDRKQYFMRVRRGKNDLIDNYLSVIKYPVYNMSLHIDLDRLDIVVQCFNNKEKIVLAYKRLYGDTLFNVFYGNNDLFVSELLPGGDNFFKVIAKHIYVIMKYLDEPLDYLTIGMPIDLRLSKHSFFSEAVAIWPPIFRLRVKEFLIQVPANSGHYSNMVKFMEFLNREDLTSTQIRSKSEEYRANFMSALNDSESVSAAYKDEQEMRKRGKEEEKRVEVLEVRIGRVTTQHFDKLAPDFNVSQNNGLPGLGGLN